MNDISDHLPIFTLQEENLAICKAVPMVSYMKVRNKSKMSMNIFCEKLAMESWHSVYNAVDVNTTYNNCINIIDNLFSKYCPIIIIKSKRIFYALPNSNCNCNCN